MKIPACVLSLWLAAAPALAQTQAQPSAPPPSGCDTPESHQFDFWVGKWDVYPAAHPDTKVADSLIEKLYGGCAVRENWMPLKGNAGGSLNAWEPDKRRWRQTWLSVGGFADFTGGLDGTAMVIQGDWGGTQTRMTYTPLADGSVEQKGETTTDNGATWQPSFDFIYRRAP